VCLPHSQLKVVAEKKFLGAQGRGQTIGGK